MLYMRFTALGVNLDVDPIDLPDSVWTEALNMVAKPGRMQRALGHREIWATPLYPPIYVQYTLQLDGHYWVYAGTSGLATVNESGTHADITPASFTNPVDPNGWSGGNLNGIAVVNSLENEPYYWHSAITDAVALPGQRASTKYRVMRPFKYHLIALGVEDATGAYWDQVHWSDAADPGQIPATWVPAADNEAGDNILADETGDIIDGMTLRDSFYIYKQDSIYEMSYIGGNQVFRFRKVFGTVGVLARNCIVRVKGTHVVLGNGDIYQHDGQNIQSIVDGKLRDTFFEGIDNDNYEASFAVYLERKEEVWFCVPQTGQTKPNLALTWNVTTGEFGYRSIPEADFAGVGIISPPSVGTLEAWEDDPDAWEIDTSVWLDQTFDTTEDGILIADATNTRLLQADTGTTHEGVPYTAAVGRMGLMLDDPREKAIRRLWPRINAPEGTEFTVELFNQREPSRGAEVLGSFPYLAGARDGLPINVNARYMGMRISSDAAVNWDVSGVDIEYLPRGHF